MNAKQALLIVDMINLFEFPEGKNLLKSAIKAGKYIARLKKKFQNKNLPVIYINDNFGKWKEDWKLTQQACEKSPGAPLAKFLRPGPGDFFILKPKHSAFHETQLSSLLEVIGAKRLMITGVAGNICVLFTVNDAHARGFEVIVPRDAIASNTKAENDFALRQFKSVFKIKTPLAAQVRME